MNEHDILYNTPVYREKHNLNLFFDGKTMDGKKIDGSTRGSVTQFFDYSDTPSITESEFCKLFDELL